MYRPAGVKFSFVVRGSLNKYLKSDTNLFSIESNVTVMIQKLHSYQGNGKLSHPHVPKKHLRRSNVQMLLFCCCFFFLIKEESCTRRFNFATEMLQKKDRFAFNYESTFYVSGEGSENPYELLQCK